MKFSAIKKMQLADSYNKKNFIWCTADDKHSVVTDAWDANTVVLIEFQSIKDQRTTNLFQQIARRRSENFILIGIFTDDNIEALTQSDDVSAVASHLKLLDGIIVAKHHVAEIVKLMTLLPTSVLPATSISLRSSINQNKETLHFLLAFIRQVRLAKAVLSACPVIASELKYMGVDDNDSLVDLLSKNISHLLPQT